MALLFGWPEGLAQAQNADAVRSYARNLTEARCNESLQQVANGMQVVMGEMAEYWYSHLAFAEMGAAMIEQWSSGMERSLAKGLTISAQPIAKLPGVNSRPALERAAAGIGEPSK